MFTAAQNDWLIQFLGGDVGRQLALLPVGAGPAASALPGAAAVAPAEPQRPAAPPILAAPPERSGAEEERKAAPEVPEVPEVEGAAGTQDAERTGALPAVIIPVVLEGVKDLFGELIARVHIVNNTSRVLKLDTTSLKLSGGHWKTQPVGSIAAKSSDVGIVAHTEKNLLIASTEDVEGTLRYFAGDDKTVWACHFHNPRIPLITSNSAKSAVTGPGQSTLQKSDDAGPGNDAVFTFTLGEPGDQPNPTPPPGGQAATPTSCLVSIVNSSKQTIFLRKQDKVAGDYVTSPPPSLAPGASAQFVFTPTPGAKDQGCRGLLEWDVGDPAIASWQLMWDNPHQQKNLSVGRIVPEQKGLHTLDQIGQGDENVPVTFTLSGDGGGVTPPAGGRTATITVSNRSEGPIVLASQSAISGDFKQKPPANIPAGGQATIIQGGDALGTAIQGELVWIVGDAKTSWRNGWTLPADGSGTAASGIDPASQTLQETHDAKAGQASFTLSGKGGPGPKPAPFAPPPESKQPTLRPKDQSPDGWVEYAQQLLNKNGAHLKVDGNFGPATEKAVRDFQQSKGCQVDGVIGNETWSMLRENTTKDAVGTDGRTPHTFEEKGVQARFATEKRFTTAYSETSDELTLVVMCVGEQSIESYMVTVRPVGATTSIQVAIGNDMKPSPDGQGNHYLVHVKGFAGQFGVTPQSVSQNGIDAYLDEALGGDRWTGRPNQ